VAWFRRRLRETFCACETRDKTSERWRWEGEADLVHVGDEAADGIVFGHDWYKSADCAITWNLLQLRGLRRSTHSSRS